MGGLWHCHSHIISAGYQHVFLFQKTRLILWSVDVWIEQTFERPVLAGKPRQDSDQQHLAPFARHVADGNPSAEGSDWLWAWQPRGCGPHPWRGCLVRRYSPVMTNVAIENYHLQWVFLWNMMSFHRYVSLPEGRSWLKFGASSFQENRCLFEYFSRNSDIDLFLGFSDRPDRIGPCCPVGSVQQDWLRHSFWKVSSSRAQTFTNRDRCFPIEQFR